jgi:hypothetical protein
VIGFLGKPSLFQALTTAKPSTPVSVAPSLGKADPSIPGKKLLPGSADFAGLFQSMVNPKPASDPTATPDSTSALSQLRDLLAGLLTQVVGEPVEVAGAEETQEGVLFLLKPVSPQATAPIPDTSASTLPEPAAAETGESASADLSASNLLVVFVPSESFATPAEPGLPRMDVQVPASPSPKDSEVDTALRPLLQFLNEAIANTAGTSADSLVVGTLPARQPLLVRESFAGQPPLGSATSHWEAGLVSAEPATPAAAEMLTTPSAAKMNPSTFQKPALVSDLPSSLLKLFIPPMGTGGEEGFVGFSLPETPGGSTPLSGEVENTFEPAIPKDWLAQWLEKTENRVVRDLGRSLAGGNRKANDTSFFGIRSLGAGQADLLRDLGIRFARIQTVSAPARVSGLKASTESPAQESLLALRIGQTLHSVAPDGATATVHRQIAFGLGSDAAPPSVAGAATPETGSAQEASTLENLMPAKLASLLSRETSPSHPAVKELPESGTESPDPAEVLKQDPIAKPEVSAPKATPQWERGLEALLPRIAEKVVTVDADYSPPSSDRGSATPAAPVQPATSTPAAAATSTSPPGPGVQESPILDQVAKVLKTPEAQRGTEIRLRLVPESLGEMHIRIGMKEGVLTAEFRASSELTREILTRDSHHLQNLLAQSGLRAEHVVIRTGNLGGENSSSLYSQERESSQTAQKDSGSKQGNGQEGRGHGSQEGNPQGRNRQRPSLWDRWEQLF